MTKYDAIIIGAGQGGVPLAKKLAKAGWKTMLIEKNLVGGTCINTGCTPTKTMVASARMAWLAGKSSEMGIHIDHYSVDLPAILKRKNKIVESFRHGAERGIAATPNLELVYGDAKFTGQKTISVSKKEGGNEEEFTGEHIFINTGTATIIPPIDGIEQVPYLTSTTIMELEEIPNHLLIVGAGYIGMEFSQMFRRFGSEVTLLEYSPAILSHEDTDVAEIIGRILKQDGINIHLNAKATKLEKAKDNSIVVTVKINDSEQRIACSHVLIATGRSPQTSTLQAEKAGVQLDEHGHIKTNEKLETTAPGIYALGDVKGGPAFTHISYNDYLILADNLLHNGHSTITGRLVPYCMFTDPQLGRVGITEKEAKAKGINHIVAKLPIQHVARAVETGETRGLMKAVVNPDTKQILGVAILGEQGGEIMSILQIAMIGKIGYDQIRTNIFAHPLYAESLNNLFMSLDK